MGFEEHGIAFLAGARQDGVSFEDCATIGRQDLVISRSALRRAYALAGCCPPPHMSRVVRGPVDPVLADFGASEVVSIDASSYEGASVVHDFNQEIPEGLKDRFSVVVDAGSLEHIFDFPTAISNYMRMVKPGGHLLLITPANNEAGHGFYQFSPELIYRALSRRYGFEVEAMHMIEPRAWRPRWYAVMDPEAVGARAQFRSRTVTYLFVNARRCGVVTDFEPPPTQSDYAAHWRQRGQPPAEHMSDRALRRVATKMPTAWRAAYLQWCTRRRSLLKRTSYKRLPSHFRATAHPWSHRQ